MLGTIHRSTRDGLAYDKHGAGVPVVFLHGLTFDRTTWRPIIERLGEDVCSIAFDLPGHGETGGEPCTLREAAARVNAALEGMEIDEPVIVGHSISSGIASIYAASYPVRGHHVHLAEADRFAARLRSSIDRCWRDGERPRRGRATAIHRRMEG